MPCTWRTLARLHHTLSQRPILRRHRHTLDRQKGVALLETPGTGKTPCRPHKSYIKHGTSILLTLSFHPEGAPVRLDDWARQVLDEFEFVDATIYIRKQQHLEPCAV